MYCWKFILKYIPGQTIWDNWLLWSLHQSSKQQGSQVQRHFLEHEQTSYTNVTIYWMHLRVNSSSPAENEYNTKQTLKTKAKYGGLVWRAAWHLMDRG